MILLEEGKEELEIVINAEGEQDLKVVKKGMKRVVADEELAKLEQGRNVALRKMLRFRVRYFTDGAVIGSRAFVDEIFREARERFGPKRKTGARKLRGAASAAAGLIWSARDLRKEI
jgi:putative transposase